jgi:hypothetical protein
MRDKKRDEESRLEKIRLKIKESTGMQWGKEEKE